MERTRFFVFISFSDRSNTLRICDLPNSCNTLFWLSLTKAFYRTEVVGALMTHLGASISSEKVCPQLKLD